MKQANIRIFIKEDRFLIIYPGTGQNDINKHSQNNDLR